MNAESDTPNPDGHEVIKQYTGPDQKLGESTRVRAEVERIVDKLGMPVDEAIKEPVVALLANDFPTSGSCEGHLDRGLPYPWVEIYAPAPEGWKESEQKQQEWRRANQALRTEMQSLLDAFYEDRSADNEVRIKMANIGAFGAYRVQSPAELNNDEQPDEAKLARYREEMNSFAQFLLSKRRESSYPSLSAR